MRHLTLTVLRKRLESAIADDVLIEAAVFNAMRKFHRESECGGEFGHWQECSALADAYGYDSWEQWVDDKQEYVWTYRDRQQ